jgi:hypothetical protein
MTSPYNDSNETIAMDDDESFTIERSYSGETLAVSKLSCLQRAYIFLGKNKQIVIILIIGIILLIILIYCLYAGSKSKPVGSFRGSPSK